MSERKPWEASVYHPKEPRRRIPKAVRQEVLRRDGHKCARCDKSGCRLTMHHIMPRGEGGGDNVENLITLCVPCHDLVERVGILRTRRMIEAGPAVSPAPYLLPNDALDWRTWVYGGARNPNL